MFWILNTLMCAHTRTMTSERFQISYMQPPFWISWEAKDESDDPTLNPLTEPHGKGTGAPQWFQGVGKCLAQTPPFLPPLGSSGWLAL